MLVFTMKGKSMQKGASVNKDTSVNKGTPLNTGAAAGRPINVPPVADDLIPRAVVAKQLDSTQHTLRQWEVSAKGPPAIRIGRRVYYRAEAVRRWLLEQEGK